MLVKLYQKEVTVVSPEGLTSMVKAIIEVVPVFIGEYGDMYAIVP